ncbi:MAG: PHP domain-containing protein, partial [[Clostridium] leptum]
MRYHYISDSHVHSDCSFDGTDPVMMICERAAALGLYSIAVTDHCECDIYYK